MHMAVGKEVSLSYKIVRTLRHLLISNEFAITKPV